MSLLKYLSDLAVPTLISSGIVLGILKLLSGKLLGQLLQKELEKYKSQLQEKTTMLKTSLSIYAEEQNIANQRIDHQKASAIQQIYGVICKVSHPVSRIVAGSHFVSTCPEDHIEFYRDHAEAAHESSGELSNLLVNYAIYLDEPTYKQLADYSSESGFSIAHFLRVIRKNDHPGTDPSELIDLIEKERAKMSKISQGKLKDMQYELTKKFRMLLGFEKTSPQINLGKLS